jgi:hypothetical protein
LVFFFGLERKVTNNLPPFLSYAFIIILAKYNEK